VGCPVYSHPFLIGFMPNQAEVRTVVNGRLVQTVPVQTSAVMCWRQKPQGRAIYVANNTQPSLPTTGLIANLGISTELRPALSNINLLTIPDAPVVVERS